MTWHETRARWRILREIAAESDHDPSGELPWNDEYVEVFGDRESLVAALRYRWTNAQRAQLDLFLTEPVLEERLDDLRRRNAPSCAGRRATTCSAGSHTSRATIG